MPSSVSAQPNNPDPYHPDPLWDVLPIGIVLIGWEAAAEKGDGGLLLSHSPLPSLQILYHNSAFATLAGSPQTHWNGQPLSLLAPTGIQEPIQQLVAQCQQSGHPEEVSLTLGDGLKQLTVSPVPDSSTPSRPRFLATLASFPKPGLASLDPSELTHPQFRCLLHNQHQSTLLIDPQRRIRAFNTTAYDWVNTVWGKELQEGASIYEFVHEANRSNFDRDFERALAGHVVTLERWIQGKGTQPLHYEFLYAPIFNERGSIIGVCSTTLNITQHQRWLRQNDYLSALHEASLALLDRQEVGTLLQTIVTRAAQVLDAPDGFLFLVTAGDPEPYLELKVGVGISSEHVGFTLKSGEGLVGQVWQQHQPLSVEDYSTWPQRIALKGPVLKRAVLGVPLQSGSEVIGVIGVAHHEANRVFSSEEIETLQRFAQLASISLDNAQLYQLTRQEITEHQHTQEHLLTTLRSIGDGVITTDTSGRILLINPVAETLTGWPQESAAGLPLSQVVHLIHAQTRLPATDPVVEALQSQQVVGLKAQTVLVGRDGGERFVSATAAPIRHPHAPGEPAGVVLTFRDITQHRLAELSLRQSEARNRAILDALPDMVFRISRSGHYQDCLGDLSELGLSPEQLMGRPLQDLLPQDVADLSLQVIEQALATGVTQLYNYALDQEQGSSEFEARVVPISADEVLTIVRDVTVIRRHQLELLRQAEREQLFSSIALRIRQSLNLHEILGRTVAEVQQFLQTDRVLIYQFQADGSALVIAEAVAEGWPSALHQSIPAEALADRIEIYQRGEPFFATLIQPSAFPASLYHFLEELQVQANLVIPIFLSQGLWGLLVAHQCREPMLWQPFVIQLLQQLAQQLETAIQQAHLHQLMQQTNEQLERQVRVRTTQLNKQLQALQLQDQVLSTVQNAVIVAYKAGHVTYWNRFAEVLYEISADQALGELLTDIVPFDPEQGQAVLEKLSQGQTWSGELRISPPGQTPRTVLISHTPIFTGEGEVLGTISISVDITYRQQAEAAMKESEARFRTLSETTTSAIFISQGERFVDVNPAMSAITHYSRDELLSMPLYQISHPLSQMEMRQWLQENPEHSPTDSERIEVVDSPSDPTESSKLLASNHLSQREFQLLTKDGRSKWIDCTIATIPYQGKTAVLGTAVDISHRKQVEIQLQHQMQELQQLNLLKDDFLSTVSHELRTPMSNMKMSIHMLRMMLLKASELGLSVEWIEKANRYMTILHNECIREIELINDLLDLQRLEAGSQMIQYAAIDLVEWLPSVLQPFQGRTTERQQQLQLITDPELPPELNCDRTMLNRILAELLNNACKYSPPGATIQLQVSPLPGGIHFQVKNTGVEIPTAEIGQIFEKFYRIPHSDRWKQGGTGLGLALIKRLVEELQGQISLESHDNQTTFHVRFPLIPYLGSDSAPEGMTLKPEDLGVTGTSSAKVNSDPYP